MIGIIDYGLGNVHAFANVYKRLNISAAIVRTADELAAADRLVLPGVGHFDHAMELLDASGMRPALDEAVLRKKLPVIGICVGMQILAPSSEEGQRPGLAWIDGHVRRLPGGAAARLPHMGWNDVRPDAGSGLFAGLEKGARFYFLHSYFFDCAQRKNALAAALHGIDFPCAVHSDNIFGVQFHPEKSHHFGMQLLKNFAEMNACCGHA